MRRLLPEAPAERWLALGNLVNMIGAGATLTSLTVYLATDKGLTVGWAGAVLAVAGAIGLTGAIPLGHLGDRRGPRGVAAATEIICAAAIVGLLLARQSWLIAVCLGIRQFAISGNGAARGALMGTLVTPERRTALRAYQRSVTNVGFTVGALIAGLAIGSGNATALTAVIAANALTYCFGAYATLRLPTVSPQAGRRSRGTEALTDRGFLVGATVNALQSLNRVVVTVGVPLWIVYASPLPTWSVSAAVILNTVTVVALQVFIARYADTLDRARRALTAGGLFTAAACATLILAPAQGTVWNWTVLATASILLVFGEMTGAAAGWTLSYELAPTHALGQYQGLWQTFADVSTRVAGPGLMAALVAASGGWGALAAGFAVVSCVTPPLIRWSERRVASPSPSSPQHAATVGRLND
jgi:MFS family permease